MFDQEVIVTLKSFYLHHTIAQAIDANETVNLKDFWKGYNTLRVNKNIDHCWQESRQQ
jgi:hypothetical protein